MKMPWVIFNEAVEEKRMAKPWQFAKPLCVGARCDF